MTQEQKSTKKPDQAEQTSPAHEILSLLIYRYCFWHLFFDHNLCGTAIPREWFFHGTDTFRWGQSDRG